MANINAQSGGFAEVTTGNGLVNLTSGTVHTISDVTDPNEITIVAQTSDVGASFHISSTGVDYTGGGVPDLKIGPIGTTEYVFLGAFDGANFLVETSTGSYVDFRVKTTHGSNVADVNAAAFQG